MPSASRLAVTMTKCRPPNVGRCSSWRESHKCAAGVECRLLAQSGHRNLRIFVMPKVWPAVLRPQRVLRQPLRAASCEAHEGGLGRYASRDRAILKIIAMAGKKAVRNSMGLRRNSSYGLLKPCG
jgi:hypothetical protein